MNIINRIDDIKHVERIYAWNRTKSFLEFIAQDLNENLREVAYLRMEKARETIEDTMKCLYTYISILEKHRKEILDDTGCNLVINERLGV